MRFPIFRVATCALLGVAAACTHADGYALAATSVGPFSAGPDVQLTFNVDQSYWPTWTQDGEGILYAFVTPGSAAPHRCLGLLPAAGGTRIWQLCDSRAVRNDTTSSYSGYALDSGGRLLVAEATAPDNVPYSPLPQVSLWAADTATPYVRTTLLTLPLQVGGVSVTWLSDLEWTGPDTFIGLAQQLVTIPHCTACGCNPCPNDSLFTLFGNGIVVVGVIAGGRATLGSIPGTEGATAYSLAEHGTSVVFTRIHHTELFKLPVAGGTAISMPTGAAGELVGVSCRAETCVFAADNIFVAGPADPYPFGNFKPVPGVPMQIRMISLTDGADQQARVASDAVFATPRISPRPGGDVVVQVGGVWGRLQSWATNGNSFLHLYPGLVP